MVNVVWFKVGSMFVGLTWYLIRYWICIDEIIWVPRLHALFGTVAPFNRDKKRLSLTYPLLLAWFQLDQWWTKSKISLGLFHSTYNTIASCSFAASLSSSSCNFSSASVFVLFCFVIQLELFIQRNLCFTVFRLISFNTERQDNRCSYSNCFVCQLPALGILLCFR